MEYYLKLIIVLLILVLMFLSGCVLVLVVISKILENKEKEDSQEESFQLMKVTNLLLNKGYYVKVIFNYSFIYLEVSHPKKEDIFIIKQEDEDFTEFTISRLLDDEDGTTSYWEVIYEHITLDQLKKLF